MKPAWMAVVSMHEIAGQQVNYSRDVLLGWDEIREQGFISGLLRGVQIYLNVLNGHRRKVNDRLSVL